VTALSDTAGGPALDLTAPLAVVASVNEPPLRTYRRALFLRVPLGAGVDGVAVDPAATRLAVTFGPRETAYPADSSSVLRVAPLGPGLVVELDGPRQVVRVDLAVPALAVPAPAVALHRLDGDVAADNPTATGAPGTAFLPDFTDIRFAIRAASASVPSPLSTVHLTQLILRSQPTGPRVGLADPAAPDDVTPLWREAGEVQADAGEALARALPSLIAGALDRLHDAGAGAPAHLDVLVVLESDAPCLATVTDLHVPVSPVVSSFPGGQAREVLRFPGGRLTTRTVTLSLPGGAGVSRASLELVSSLRSEAPDSLGPLDPVPAERTGIAVGADGWVAGRRSVEAAVTVSGLTLGLMALVAGTELLVEVRGDPPQTPAGAVVASGRLVLAGAGDPGWFTVRFESEVVLTTAGIWLLLRAARGAAIWLAAVDEGDAVLTGPGGAGGWRVAASDLRPLARHLEPASAEGAPRELAVSVGSVPAPVSADTAGGRRRVDLTAALDGQLAARPAGQAVAVPVELSSAAEGIVTVLAPMVEIASTPS
jgi:hypothetical protein